MQCVILAGGLSTRLRPITESKPKSMVSICGKPFLEHQITLLTRSGIKEVVLCVGYLGEQIEEHFADGDKFGINIKYSDEKDELLGTGGALKNAVGLLDPDFFVLYGDSYLDIDYLKVYEAFTGSGYPSLLAVYRNNNRWDKSNVIFTDGVIELYDKQICMPSMQYIDYGLSVLTKSVIEEYIPEDTVYDLAKLYKQLSVQKKMVGFEVGKEFYEIGSLEGINRLENYMKEKGAV